MLPNFMIIGAQKSGTTTLCSLLSQHPEIFMSNPKEPMFFSHETAYQKGLAAYEKLFVGSEEYVAIGEGSTSYSAAHLHPETVRRIASTLPNCKFIYIVRHPYERTYSAWWHYLREGKRNVGPDFAKALDSNELLLDISLYWRQLQIYRQEFSDSQIKVFFFEDLKKDPQRILRECCEFLAVDPEFVPANPLERKNKAPKVIKRWVPLHDDAVCRFFFERYKISRPKWYSYRENMPSTVRAILRERLADDARTLLKYSNKPLDFWNL